MGKCLVAAIAGLAFLSACSEEPEVVVVEPVEERVVRESSIASGDGVEAREDVDAVVMPEGGAESAGSQGAGPAANASGPTGGEPQ